MRPSLPRGTRGLLFSGRLRRVCRGADGQIDVSAEPPDGYPNGNYRQVMIVPSNLRGSANGAVVEVLVNHDEGTLGYVINGGHYNQALPTRDGSARSGVGGFFPKGAPLRPYVSCYYPGDRVSFATAFV